MTATPQQLPPPIAAPPNIKRPGARPFAISSGKLAGPQRVVLYGPGKVGKTTLATLAPNAVVVDVENGSRQIDTQRVDHDLVDTFENLRACLQSDALDGFDTVILDGATKTEELAVAHTLATVKHEKGHYVTSIEGYGFGKGLQFVYDTYLLFLADLDLQVRRGRNVILVAHDCTESVPNPTGDDWIRYEPHLQRPRSGKASIRNRVVQWADHILYLGYDVVASKGKGRGSGTRTIYPAEMPTHVAGSRTLPPIPFPYTSPTDGAIWSAIFGGAR